jgi:hypothetical protein
MRTSRDEIEAILLGQFEAELVARTAQPTTVPRDGFAELVEGYGPHAASHRQVIAVEALVAQDGTAVGGRAGPRRSRQPHPPSP